MKLQKIHYKAISAILDELSIHHPNYVDIRQVILDYKILKPDNVKNRFDYNCNKIGEIVCARGICDGDENYPNYKYIRLKLKDEGVKMMDEWGDYFRFYSHNKRKTNLEHFKTKYWYLVFLSGAVIGFIFDLILECLT